MIRLKRYNSFAGVRKNLNSLIEIKAQICDVCHKMWQLGRVAANDGNVSVKLSDGRIITAPAPPTVLCIIKNTNKKALAFASAFFVMNLLKISFEVYQKVLNICYKTFYGKRTAVVKFVDGKLRDVNGVDIYGAYAFFRFAV